MTIDEKTELLRYKLLNNIRDYDMEIYSLITWSKMKDEVSRINELSFSFQVKLEENEITPRQFLIYMSEFVKCMKLYFFNIPSLHIVLTTIVRDSKKELNNLLNYRCDEPYYCFGIKNDNNIKERIYKLIISNFINNAKYIPSIEIILKENNIRLKDVQSYSLKESEKILSLLSDIVFCQRGRSLIIELFENIDIHLKEYLDKKAKSKSKKFTIEDYKEKYINSYIKNYEQIFKAYNIRKKYLRYFI